MTRFIIGSDHYATVHHHRCKRTREKELVLAVGAELPICQMAPAQI